MKEKFRKRRQTPHGKERGGQGPQTEKNQKRRGVSQGSSEPEEGERKHTREGTPKRTRSRTHTHTHTRQTILQRCNHSHNLEKTQSRRHNPAVPNLNSQHVYTTSADPYTTAGPFPLNTDISKCPARNILFNTYVPWLRFLYP